MYLKVCAPFSNCKSKSQVYIAWRVPGQTVQCICKTLLLRCRLWMPCWSRCCIAACTTFACCSLWMSSGHDVAYHKRSIMCQPLCDCYCVAVKQHRAFTAVCGATLTSPPQPLRGCFSICPNYCLPLLRLSAL